VIAQAARQALVIDQSQTKFGCRVCAWDYFQSRPINSAKAKLVWEFFTARIASFHGNLLVLCGELRTGRACLKKVFDPIERSG
jgi:hypothetical protein